MKIAVSCGGTGGHIFPGVATGQVLASRGHDVSLWLAGKSVEAASVGGWTGHTETVPSEGFPSSFSLGSLRAAIALCRAITACTRRMKLNRPDALLAMGSYASVGPALAARRLGVPVVLHEANVIPGRAIRFLSRFASAVAIGFPETRAHVRHARIVDTGFPVRPDTGRRFPPDTLDRTRFTILVMGGSQGAHALNETVAPALRGLIEKGIPVQVIHLAGRNDLETVRNLYAKAGVPGVVMDFLKDMEMAYAAADIAICRSGAATCAELSAFGVPAILIPFPWAVHGHQLANARAMESDGAARVLPQNELTSERIREEVVALHASPPAREAMARRSRARAKPLAADALADLVEACANQSRQGSER